MVASAVSGGGLGHGDAVEKESLPEAAKELDQIRRIVAINLVLGLLTVIVGTSGRFW